MYTKRNIDPSVIFKFAWKNLLFFIGYSTFILYLFHEVEHHYGFQMAIPFLPLSTIGIAVAFYLGFKNNQAYDRFWEARKIWGGIVNYSRTWGNQVLVYVSTHFKEKGASDEELKAIQKRLIYRHIAWINAFRLQLREPSSFSIDFNKSTAKKFYKGSTQGEDWKTEVGPFLSCNTEIEHVKRVKNPATHIMREQGDDLRELFEDNWIESFRLYEMMHSIEEFYNLQGKGERIKKTPFPRQFAYFSKLFTWIFILILPFGLIGEFRDLGHNYIWLTVPFYSLISWIFLTMEIVGDNSEDPFENFVNDVPLTALCRTIEIDLREMLGETDLPPAIQPVNNVLM